MQGSKSHRHTSPRLRNVRRTHSHHVSSSPPLNTINYHRGAQLVRLSSRGSVCSRSRARSTRWEVSAKAGSMYDTRGHALFRSARVGVGVHRAGACRVGATSARGRVHRTPCNGRLRLVSLANSSRWLGTALVNISRPPFEL